LLRKPFDPEEITQLAFSLTDYSIVQEALNNALKHSAATNVDVRIVIEDDAAKLEVADNGIGFILEDVSNKGGIGLKSIRERVEHLNGSLSVEATDDGTSITVEIPRKKEPVTYVIE
jgi:signal transduction histidine kinase